MKGRHSASQYTAIHKKNQTASSACPAANAAVIRHGRDDVDEDPHRVRQTEALCHGTHGGTSKHERCDVAGVDDILDRRFGECAGQRNGIGGARAAQELQTPRCPSVQPRQRIGEPNPEIRAELRHADDRRA